MLKRKNRKILTEGFGPVYDNRGMIAPGFEGLGPKKEKDLGPAKIMPPSKKREIKKEYRRKILPEKTGKRWYA